GVRAKELANAPHTGYQRLKAGRTVVIMDTGRPADGLLSRDCHAGPLSFELSAGRERLVVNCGSGTGHGEAWTQAARRTAAQSTLQVEGADSAEILPDGRFGRGPQRVSVERNADADGNTWLDAEHDGYRSLFAVLHRRRLY